MHCIYVVSDWDADGVVSAAEVVFAQEFLGLYPLKCKAKVLLEPATPRTLDKALNEAKGEVLVLLDIPYTRGVEEVIKSKRSQFKRVIYIDHHISTLVHVDRIENLVDEVLVGKSPTALLVAHVIKSLGGKLSPRLEAFVSAAAFTEKSMKKPRVDKRLVELVVKISKYLSVNKDREAWERLVRWLASPLAMTAMPFAKSISSMIKEHVVKAETERIKHIAIDLAPSAIRVANVRIVDARKVSEVKISALASQLYRIFKLPVIVIGKRCGKTMIAIRSRDDLPYRMAIEMYRRGVLKDVGGHQSLAIGIVNETYAETSKIVDIVRDCLREI